MWWRVVALALALGFAAALITPSPRISDTSGRPIVIATLPCSTRVQATSSGFVIDDQTVVTVAHAIFESRDFAIRDASGRWRDAEIRYIDLERDLAVLDVRGLRSEPMPTTDHARAGDPVRVLQGAASGTTEGEVLRPVRIRTEVIGDLSVTTQRAGYELSTPIVGGDSGAAVLDSDDRLIGLIFARSTKREAAWATSVSEIDAVLQREGGPTWTCDRPSDAVLERAPLEEPAKLAG